MTGWIQACWCTFTGCSWISTRKQLLLKHDIIVLLKTPKNIPCLDTQAYNCGQKIKVQPKAPPFFFFFGHTAQLSFQDLHSSEGLSLCPQQWKHWVPSTEPLGNSLKHIVLYWSRYSDHLSSSKELKRSNNLFISWKKNKQAHRVILKTQKFHVQVYWSLRLDGNKQKHKWHWFPRHTLHLNPLWTM